MHSNNEDEQNYREHLARTYGIDLDRVKVKIVDEELEASIECDSFANAVDYINVIVNIERE